MPLRAIINNKDIIAPNLSNDEWDKLKLDINLNKFDVILPCCSQPGNLRVSKLGLKHFYHKQSDIKCDWKPESPEHLFLKYEIIKACKESNWEAIPEFSENDWRADVLAIQGNKRIAFEVQLSKQTYEETIERQNKYKRDNVRGCWFFKSIPKELKDYPDHLKEIKDLPFFHLNINQNKEISISFNTRSVEPRNYDVKEFVNHLLNRHIKFCMSLKSQIELDIEITFIDMVCWKCNSHQHIYKVNDNLITKCERFVIAENDGMWGNNKFEFHPQILEQIETLVKDSNGHLKLGNIKKRYSKTTHSSYMSFGCYHCDSLFGDWHNMEEITEQLGNDLGEKYSVHLKLNKPFVNKYPHWCFSENGDFCE